MRKKRHLGEILIEEGLISYIDLNYALDQATQYREKLGEALIRLGYITEQQLLECLGKQHGVPSVDLYKQVVDENAVGLITKDIAEGYKVMPIGFKKLQGEDKVVLAMADPMDMRAQSLVAHLTGYPVYPVFVREEHLKWIINYYYKDSDLRVTVELPSEDRRGRAEEFEVSLGPEDAEEIIDLDTPISEE